MERQTARGKRRNGAGAQVRGYRTAEAKDKGSTAGRILRAQTTRARSSTPPHGKGDGDCAWEVANQLETETVGEETTYYHYDGCGNTVAKQEPEGTTYFIYDTENLLTRIDFADDTHNYFSYDADSKRVSGQTSDSYREYVYQGPDMLKLQLERDEGGDTIAQYTMADGLESVRRDNASSFYHYNRLGTTLALTGADEAVTDTWRHGAWGVELQRTGTTVNPHTYVGEEGCRKAVDVELYHLEATEFIRGSTRSMTGMSTEGGWIPAARAAGPMSMLGILAAGTAGTSKPPRWSDEHGRIPDVPIGGVDPFPEPGEFVRAPEPPPGKRCIALRTHMGLKYLDYEIELAFPGRGKQLHKVHVVKGHLNAMVTCYWMREWHIWGSYETWKKTTWGCWCWPPMRSTRGTHRGEFDVYAKQYGTSAFSLNLAVKPVQNLAARCKANQDPLRWSPRFGRPPEAHPPADEYPVVPW